MLVKLYPQGNIDYVPPIHSSASDGEIPSVLLLWYICKLNRYVGYTAHLLNTLIAGFTAKHPSNTHTQPGGVLVACILVAGEYFSPLVHFSRK